MSEILRDRQKTLTTLYHTLYNVHWLFFSLKNPSIKRSFEKEQGGGEGFQNTKKETTKNVPIVDRSRLAS